MTINAGESAVFERRAAEIGSMSDAGDVPAVAPVEQFDVHYSCLRCGTITSRTEIDKLPEIKCICGFKVFVKARPPVVKTIKAV